MTPNRRQFLRYTAALGLSGAAASILDKLILTSAWAQTQTDYKALVCIFFAGGNDANQMIVPLSGATGFGAADVTGGYTAYFNERNAQGLAIAAPPATGTEGANQLLRINPGAANPALGTFGMHYNLGGSNADRLTFNATTGTVTIQVPSLKALYDQGKVAVVCNVGSLWKSFNKAQYQSQPTNRPDQLFSHSDQVRENQTCIFTLPQATGLTGGSGTGWGGRTADKVTLNGLATFPMQTSISGAPQFMSGVNTFPIAISPYPTALNQVLVLNGFGTAADEVARKTAFNHLRTINQTSNKLVDAVSRATDEALNVSSALSVDPQLVVPDPAAPTVASRRIQLAWPNTGIANQLRQVAKVIKANLQQPALALKRQIFFVQIGGYDTHQNQNATQPGLLLQVNQALATFYYWLANNAPQNGTTEPTLGDLSSKVTAFTLSDFSRTFNPSGSGGIVGTDHAWGSHWLVVGGAVNGGLTGLPLPGGNGSVFPTLGKGASNAYDVDNAGGRGRWIPSVSTMQYANTLAKWFGLAQDNTTLDYVFPTLRTNFATTSLGFV
jgi:uncharacterized protein (DUF1501 family)